MPVNDVFHTENEIGKDKVNYCHCEVRCITQANGQVQNIYVPDSSNIEILNAVVSADMFITKNS